MSITIDWFDLHAVQGTLESSLAPQFESTQHSILQHLAFSRVLLSHPCMTTKKKKKNKKRSFDYTVLCQQGTVSAF